MLIRILMPTAELVAEPVLATNWPLFFCPLSQITFCPVVYELLPVFRTRLSIRVWSGLSLAFELGLMPSEHSSSPCQPFISRCNLPVSLCIVFGLLLLA